MTGNDQCHAAVALKRRWILQLRQRLGGKVHEPREQPPPFRFPAERDQRIGNARGQLLCDVGRGIVVDAKNLRRHLQTSEAGQDRIVGFDERNRPPEPSSPDPHRLHSQQDLGCNDARLVLGGEDGGLAQRGILDVLVDDLPRPRRGGEDLREDVAAQSQQRGLFCRHDGGGFALPRNHLTDQRARPQDIQQAVRSAFFDDVADTAAQDVGVIGRRAFVKKSLAGVENDVIGGVEQSLDVSRRDVGKEGERLEESIVGSASHAGIDCFTQRPLRLDQSPELVSSQADTGFAPFVKTCARAPPTHSPEHIRLS